MPWDPNAREAVSGARGSYPGNQAVPETGRSREKQLTEMCNILTRVENCDGFSNIKGKTNLEESSNKNKISPKGGTNDVFLLYFF